MFDVGQDVEAAARASLAAHDQAAAATRWLWLARQLDGQHGHRQAYRLPRVLPRCPVLSALEVQARIRAAKKPRAKTTDRNRVLRAWQASGSHRGKPGFVCPGVADQDARRACVGAMVAAALLSPAVHVAAAGIDTLELFTRAPVDPVSAAHLVELQKTAERAKLPQPVEIGGLECRVEAFRLKGAIVVRDASGGDLFTFRVRPDAPDPEPTIMVECRALALWSRGYTQTAAQAARAMQALCSGADLDLQVSRLDLTVDFQGWEPSPEDRSMFVTRARRRGRFWDGSSEPQWDDEEFVDKQRTRALRLMRMLEKAATPARRRRVLELLHRPEHDDAGQREYDVSARVFSGFAFGSGHHLTSRLYNKTREVRKTRKTWFEGVWARRDESDVWRLEYQLRREALRQLVTDDGQQWEDLSSWSACAQGLDRLWHWLTTRFVRHGWREKDQRMVLSRPWKQLHAARQRFDAGDMERPELDRHVEKGALTTLTASSSGYLHSMVAQMQELQGVPEGTPYGEMMMAALAAACEHAARKEDTPEEVLQRKREEIAARRRWMERRAPTHGEHVAARARARWEGSTRWRKLSVALGPSISAEGGRAEMLLAMTPREVGS